MAFSNDHHFGTSMPWSGATRLIKLIKIGAKVVSHGRYVAFRMAEVAIPRDLFADISRLIAELRQANWLFPLSERRLRPVVCHPALRRRSPRRLRIVKDAKLEDPCNQTGVHPVNPGLEA